MKQEPKRISLVLEKLLKARGFEGRLTEYRLAGAWQRIAGAGIAGHSRPAALRGKKLTLIVDGNAWMQQLSLLKPELIKRIGQEIGAGTVRDIVFRLGEVVQDRVQPASAAPPRDLDPADRERIEAAIRTIGDEPTRDAVRRLIEKDVLAKRSMRGR